MIGSFWNLCRACPSMPVDKLHSEYRSTYRWHEYTGPRQEVVRRAPQANAAPAAGTADKPNDLHSSKQDEDLHNDLPKLEPAMPRRKKYPDLAYRHHEFLISEGETTPNGGACLESRARSEERNRQWRPSRRSKSEGPARHGAPGDGIRERERRRESDPDLENMGRETGLLRKAISKISTEYRLQFAWPQGHTSRRDAVDAKPRKSQSMGALKPASNAMVHKKRTDLENRDASELEPLVDERNTREDKTSIYKDDFNGESEYQKKFRPFSQYEYSDGRFTKRDSMNGENDDAGLITLPLNSEKNHSWYKEVVELRKKAGEYKSYTKEEKEVDNNSKTSPSKAARNAENSARIVRDMIRHHLERTTGGSDGLILSPTREKLEPTIPRKDDDSRSSQKNSPKKSSPLKSTSLKRHYQKSKGGPKTMRSQSVGPTTEEKRSPKRQSRSATVKERKSSATPTSQKRPRPSSLNTTASSRSKHSSVPPKSEDDRLAKPSSKPSSESKQKLAVKQLEKGIGGAEPPKETEIIAGVATIEAPEVVNFEPVVKSPPEPTRVKSPEQILMRSPDPVNWTVPLDTGKTFTVTQNVREGDLSSRPHSEVKAWTPPDIPPPVAQSAPPALTEQTSKDAGMDLAARA